MTPILPDQIESYTGNLVLTTRRETRRSSARYMFFEEMIDSHPTVLRGIILQRLDPDLGERKLVLGIDPGRKLGLSVYYLGREIESSFYSSVDGLVSHIATILSDLQARRKIVKIGNGDMTQAREIGARLKLESLSRFELEFVDESGTSLKIRHFNQSGKRDRLSAKYITQRESVAH